MAIPQIVMLRSGMNPDIVLSAFNGQAVVAWIDPESPAQQWIRQDNDRGFHLINVATGTGLLAPNVGEDQFLTVADGGSLWTTGGDEALKVINLVGHDLHVSIRGGGLNLGTPAILSDWDGGEGYELWRIHNVKDIEPFQKVTVQIFAAGMRTLLIDDGERYTIDYGGDPPTDDRFRFEMVSWSKGYSFRNKKTKKLIGFMGYGKELGHYDLMCVQALWQFGPLRPDGFGTFLLWENTDLMWTVFCEGAPTPGSDVGVRSWDDGDGNQLFREATPRF